MIPLLASAEYKAGVVSTVTSVVNYNFPPAAGDITIQIKQPAVGCESGYFILSGTEGANASLSIALTAFHSGAKVIISGHTGKPWIATGRSDYCQLHAIQLIK
jgi:hypothetical protein